MLQTNILLTSTGKPLLIDFGLSHALNPGVTTARLTTDGQTPGKTLNWAAPELLPNPKLFESTNVPDESLSEMFYTKEADVWSFGMTIYVRKLCYKLFFAFIPDTSIGNSYSA